MNKRPLSPTSPQTAYGQLPAHYSNGDVPHALARVRFMQRFVDEVVDENDEMRRFLPELHGTYMDMLNEELAPYALDLALSLVALEDSLDKK